jgi:hypothetical protein
MDINFTVPVGIAEEVGKHIDVDIDASGTKGGDNGQNVVGGPACNKCTYGKGSWI